MPVTSQILPYFTNEESCLISQIEGRKFVKANQLFWENFSNPNKKLTILMELELVFEDGSSISFCAEEERSGLSVGKTNLLEVEEKLRELGSKLVKMRSSTPDEDDNWEPFLGEAIQAIEMRPAGPGIYMNDGLIIDFGFAKLMISRPLDAIEVEELVNEDEEPKK